MSQFVPKTPRKWVLNSPFNCVKNGSSKFWEHCMVVSSTCRKVNKNPVFSAKSNGLEPRPRYRYQAFLSDSFQRGMADCASFSLGAVTFQEPLLYVLRLPRCMKPGWILHPCQPHCALAFASRRRQVRITGQFVAPASPTYSGVYNHLYLQYQPYKGVSENKL